MFIIVAIWGLVIGVVFPLSMLLFSEIGEALPVYIPILWLFATVAGYITPCVFVKLKMYRIAAGLSIGGAILLLVLHLGFLDYITENMVFNGGFYLPLLIAILTVITMAGIDMAEKARQKHNAPAESILGNDGYRNPNDPSQSLYKMNISDDSPKQRPSVLDSFNKPKRRKKKTPKSQSSKKT